ncbi:MAG: hypothetical protein JNL73_25030, partial [Anaerolineales bacterium]|nr:hypothetical protein [Anaerolineales bacterium]
AADRIATLLFGRPLPESERAALLAELPNDEIDSRQLLVAALLASPRFQWH